MMDKEIRIQLQETTAELLDEMAAEHGLDAEKLAKMIIYEWIIKEDAKKKDR